MKNEETRLDRREFSLAAALAVLSGVSITISACGGGGSSPTGGSPTPAPTPTPSAADKIGQISANHGHTAVITAARLASPIDINLDIKGTSGHTHTVSLSAAEIGQIAGSTRVTKTSTTDDGHSHDVTFN